MAMPDMSARLDRIRQGPDLSRVDLPNFMAVMQENLENRVGHPAYFAKQRQDMARPPAGQTFTTMSMGEEGGGFGYGGPSQHPFGGIVQPGAAPIQEVSGANSYGQVKQPFAVQPVPVDNKRRTSVGSYRRRL